MTVTAETNHFTISGAGKISGIATLVKTGAGTLTLTTTNDYTGVTTISGGVVRAPLLTNGGVPSSIGAAASSAANLVIDGGTLRWIGVTNTTANRGFTVTTNGGAVEGAPPVSANLTLSGAIAYSGSGARTLTLGGSDPNPLAIGGNILSSIIADPSGGPLTLVKNGNNAWNFSGNNTYSGGSVVNGGRLRANTSTNAFGTGPVTVADGAQAYCNVGGPFGNAFFIAGIGIAETEGNYGALRLAQNGANAVNTVTLTGNARITARGATAAGAAISGKITGDFGLEFGNSGGGAGVLSISNSANDWSGNTTISHGTLKLGAVNVIPHGTEKGDVIVNNSNSTNNSAFDLNGVSTTINGLASTGADSTRCIVTNGNATAATLTVGDNDATATFAGIIKNGVGIVALAKTGGGTETLTGANTYTGATTVNGGTLIVNGSLASSAVTVNTGATLGGNGTLNGTVTATAGSTISPGTSIGALTVNSTVTLQGTTLMELNKAAATNDVIRGATTIDYGGILALTNLGGALAAGDSFKLFYAGNYTGAFTTLTPSSPGPGLVWDTSALNASGTLSIAIAPPPVISSIVLSAGALVISGTNGPANGTYLVLSSTNLASPLSNWSAIATNTFSGSGTFSFTNATDPAAARLFYVLQLQ
jgi:fibronectin-binding autotransporter adhesin